MTCVNQIGPNLKKTELNKEKFTLKPPTRDGLILQIKHFNEKAQRVRFLRASFSENGNQLIAGDNSGFIFVIDFYVNKYWGLCIGQPSSAMKFSSLHERQALIGCEDGVLCVIDVNAGIFISKLYHHMYPIKNLSFSYTKNLCLSSSHCEAVVWDLKKNNRLQVLTIKNNCILKHVIFVPCINDVLICFQDDVIQIWKYGSFENYKQIRPTAWNRHPVKSISFTRNGKVMVIAGHSSELAVFTVECWKLLKIFCLSDKIIGIKQVEFISEPFDGGNNKILAILTSSIMYFYNMESDMVLACLNCRQEIIRFETTLTDKYIACILCSGEIYIYTVFTYLRIKQNQNCKVIATKPRKRPVKNLGKLKEKMKEVLDVDKLRGILNEFGQYPDAFRLQIWKKLLELPNNVYQYNAIINHVTYIAFEDFESEFPLQNKIALKNTRKLLNNLVTWCPFLSKVEYLPELIFPFVVIFQNDPVLCFEAVCSIIVNWCQHWFEYHPLPPINLLAIIENIMLEHDKDLLLHLAKHKITAQLYAWPILRTLFSEALTKPQWNILWDHVLTNEPGFLLLVAVAYNILHRVSLLSLTKHDTLKGFYCSQNPTDIKRLLQKTYKLHKNTSKENHPSKYIKNFEIINTDTYPELTNYPNTVIDYVNTEIEKLKKEAEEIKASESEIFNSQLKEQQRLLEQEMNQIENERLKELEKVYMERILNEQERVQERRTNLVNLRRQLHQEQLDMMNTSHNKVRQQNIKDRLQTLEKLINDLDHNKYEQNNQVLQVEEDLMKHYQELFKHKIHIQELLSADVLDSFPRADHILLKKQQNQLAEEIDQIRREAQSKCNLKYLNVAAGIEAMDNLIERVEIELAREMTERFKHFNKCEANLRVAQLEAETKDLELEVDKLLEALAYVKLRESKTKMQSLGASIKDRKALVAEQKYIATMQKQLGEVTAGDSKMNIFCRNFKSIKKLLKNARDGYQARPSSPTKK